MKIKQKLMSSPSSIIALICLLVGIIFLNNYLNNYRHQITNKQLRTSMAMLKTIQDDPEEDLNVSVSEKLRQMQILEKNARRLEFFGQFASLLILFASLLLGMVFFRNLNIISNKLQRLSAEVKQISQGGYLDECRLDYPLSGELDNEIDNLAINMEQILRNFKNSIREKNGILNMLQKTNQELKHRINQKSHFV
jgi:methyl-accepting chemotaxis protein